MSEHKKIIAIDFDGVIHKYSGGWLDGTIYDIANEGAFRALIKLGKNYKLVIFTTRAATPNQVEQIREWIKEQWKNVPDLNRDDLKYLLSIEITNIKPLAFCFIDDRAIRFTNWQDTLNYF
jgi:5'(3')-deoxyribonucleotidase